MNLGNMVSRKSKKRKSDLVSNYIVQKPLEIKPVEPPLIQAYYKKSIDDYINRNAWMDKVGLQLTDEKTIEENEENMVKVEIRRSV